MPRNPPRNESWSAACLIHRTSSRPGLHRVAHAVEAGEVSADLLTDLRAEIAEARERPPADRHAFAVQELAERFDVPVDRLTELLAALEAQPSVTRELFFRRFVEAWLKEQ